MITVSKDNTGDYTSIQEAVDAISSSTVSETIFIKNGTYNRHPSCRRVLPQPGCRHAPLRRRA